MKVILWCFVPWINKHQRFDLVQRIYKRKISKIVQIYQMNTIVYIYRSFEVIWKQIIFDKTIRLKNYSNI